MSRLFRIVFFAIVVSLTAIAHAQQKPDPSLSPQDVVALQLEGFKKNDIEGLRQAWEFAHPSNKAVTGPLERFALMLNAPNYKILLGHRKAEIKPVTEEGGVATFEVTVVGAEGAVVIYSWSLQ
ncbi:MAG: DUF4864 domain-containing protein, partial [Hyphomicrobiales bacterium]|nr:DUF4864 domain-containing protein [Hyphomicrobiales bacterium]